MTMIPVLCKDCKWQKEGQCTRFDFKADMRDDHPWCKSGAEKE